MRDPVLALNAKLFGARDPYSQPVAWAQRIVQRKRGQVAGYILYAVHPEFIEILRLGTAPAHRRRGIARGLLAVLKRRARRLGKPVRTYLAYDNLPSYVLHIKAGFYPTHVAWCRWVWVEYQPSVRAGRGKPVSPASRW